MSFSTNVVGSYWEVPKSTPFRDGPRELWRPLVSVRMLYMCGYIYPWMNEWLVGCSEGTLVLRMSPMGCKSESFAWKMMIASTDWFSVSITWRNQSIFHGDASHSANEGMDICTRYENSKSIYSLDLERISQRFPMNVPMVVMPSDEIWHHDLDMWFFYFSRSPFLCPNSWCTCTQREGLGFPALKVLGRNFQNDFSWFWFLAKTICYTLPLFSPDFYEPIHFECPVSTIHHHQSASQSQAADQLVGWLVGLTCRGTPQTRIVSFQEHGRRSTYKKGRYCCKSCSVDLRSFFTNRTYTSPKSNIENVHYLLPKKEPFPDLRLTAW